MVAGFSLSQFTNAFSTGPTNLLAAHKNRQKIDNGPCANLSMAQICVKNIYCKGFHPEFDEGAFSISIHNRQLLEVLSDEKYIYVKFFIKNEFLKMKGYVDDLYESFLEDYKTMPEKNKKSISIDKKARSITIEQGKCDLDTLKTLSKHEFMNGKGVLIIINKDNIKEAVQDYGHEFFIVYLENGAQDLESFGMGSWALSNRQVPYDKNEALETTANATSSAFNNNNIAKASDTGYVFGIIKNGLVGDLKAVNSTELNDENRLTHPYTAMTNSWNYKDHPFHKHSDKKEYDKLYKSKKWYPDNKLTNHSKHHTKHNKAKDRG